MARRTPTPLEELLPLVLLGGERREGPIERALRIVRSEDRRRRQIPATRRRDDAPHILRECALHPVLGDHRVPERHPEEWRIVGALPQARERRGDPAMRRIESHLPRILDGLGALGLQRGGPTIPEEPPIPVYNPYGDGSFKQQESGGSSGNLTDELTFAFDDPEQAPAESQPKQATTSPQPTKKPVKRAPAKGKKAKGGGLTKPQIMLLGGAVAAEIVILAIFAWLLLSGQ